MIKEIDDVEKVCNELVTKSKGIIDTANSMKKLTDEIKVKTREKDIFDVSLSIRKELTSLYLLNSNMKDNMVMQSKIFKSLKNLKND